MYSLIEVQYNVITVAILHRCFMEKHVITAQPAQAVRTAKPLLRSDTQLTEKQYQLLLDLYHQMNDEFQRLSLHTQSAFFQRLYAH